MICLKMIYYGKTMYIFSSQTGYYPSKNFQLWNLLKLTMLHLLHHIQMLLILTLIHLNQIHITQPNPLLVSEAYLSLNVIGLGFINIGNFPLLFALMVLQNPSKIWKNILKGYGSFIIFPLSRTSAGLLYCTNGKPRRVHQGTSRWSLVHV